ncbi:NAD(P)H-dependent oxidoreductase [uncultured Shimia sp.]|uniref:FMN-dependent NADH-azoreductase n=1 Tax=uncultured Shimia sp. TaxID=573152 RepID=UPI0025E3282F|nr:NAD(P)H-dependent oxidoreductase [uncultured Shimia sp.]
MTHTVLHIDSSARFTDSASRSASAALVEKQNPTHVIRRDLSETTLPFLNEGFAQATFTPPEARTEDQKAALETSDTLVAELQAADTIVIGAPIYNFSIPASLKAWIDQIARVGVTFAYSDTGPKGLLEGKKVVITLASGGTEIGSDIDFASGYLRFVLGFLGITDVTVLNNDGAEVAAKAA